MSTPIEKKRISPDLFKEFVWKHFEKMSNFRLAMELPVGRTGVDVAVIMDSGKVVGLEEGKQVYVQMWLEDDAVENYEMLNVVSEDLAANLVKELFKNIKS